VRYRLPAARWVALATLLLVRLPAPLPAQARPCLPDPLNPKYFVNVTEIVRGEKNHVIHSAANARATRCADDQEGSDKSQGLAAEISVASRLQISFDDEFIKASNAGTGFEGEIGISAVYVRGGKQFPMEVPSYSTVTQGAAVAAVRIESAQEALKILNELNRVHHDILDSLGQATLTEERYRLNADSALRRLAERNRTILASITKDSTALAAQLASLRQKPDSGMVAPDTTALRQFAQLQERRSAQLRDLTARAENELRSADLAVRHKATRDRANAFLSRRAVLTLLVKRLPAPEDAGLTRAIAFALQADAGVIAIQARRELETLAALDSAYKELLADTTRRKIDPISHAEQHIDELRVAMEDLAGRISIDRFSQDSLLRQVTLSMIRNLKETDLIIPNSPVEEGDMLVLSISNFSKEVEKRRDLQIRLKAVSFGLRRRLSDATLLLNRIGVSADGNQAMIEALEDGKSVVTQAPVNFAPTPGASLTWSYYPRRGGTWSQAARFLHLGIGLAVATPTFGRTITTRKDTALSAREDKNQFDIGLGPVVTLFDGLMAVNYGWVITAAKKKSYWGLGLSFVSLANGVVSAIQGR
jgi:hypothetical protein